mgnify:CR=1 FL=1
MSTYKAITLVNRPHDRKIGPHLFESKELEIPTPKDGQILIKQTHMSLDPAMLVGMKEGIGKPTAPVGRSDVMRSSGVGEVVESNNPNFSVGDKVMGMTGWSEYVLSDGSGYINGEVVTIDGGEWLKGAGEFNDLDRLPKTAWKIMEKLRTKSRKK